MSELFVRCVCKRKIRLRVESAGKVGKCTCGQPVRGKPASIDRTRPAVASCATKCLEDWPIRLGMGRA